MSEWIAELLAGLAATPWLQALAAALATFVLEDPTTVGAGLLVADGKMAFVTAFIGVSAGIAIGDLGLYGGGRLLGPRIIGRGPLTEGRIDRAGRWFHRNLVQAVVFSRFVPGMRLPTYLGAGVLRAPLWKFALTAVAASIVWTFGLLLLTVKVGEAVLPLLGRWRWPVAVAVLVVLIVAQRLAAKRLNGSDTGEEAGAEPAVSAFEFWPPWLFYFPVFLYWLWLSVRHRGLLLPTAANPSIHAGGFIGESKAQILGLVPPEEHRWVAPWIRVETPGPETGVDESLETVLAEMSRASLPFPLVAKPDVGQRGAGVRPVADQEDLRRYLEAFPRGEGLILQELAGDGAAGSPDDHPSGLGDAREAGVLWRRLPGEERGRIFSITLKIFPEVVGDGLRTLAELIDSDPRARHIAEIYRSRHLEELERVLSEGERFPLVFAGNHCQGAIFRDGTNLATAALEERIESIARSLPEFWFGRFDIRFDSLAAFLDGKDFKIVEINGASAEATHIWDARMALGEAYGTLFEQFRLLFRIGGANRRRGHKPMRLRRFFADLAAYRRLAQNYPETE